MKVAGTRQAGARTANVPSSGSGKRRIRGGYELRNYLMNALIITNDMLFNKLNLRLITPVYGSLILPVHLWPFCPNITFSP